MEEDFSGNSERMICPTCHDPKGWFYGHRAEEIPADQRTSEVGVFREVLLRCMACETLVYVRFYGCEDDCRVHLEVPQSDDADRIWRN